MSRIKPDEPVFYTVTNNNVLNSRHLHKEDAIETAKHYEALPHTPGPWRVHRVERTLVYGKA